MTAPRPFHFAVVVWGEAYIDTFLRIVLPSHLAPGNLPAFPGLGRCTYAIHTTAADVARFEASPAFRRLCELLPTRLVARPEGLDPEDRYERLIQGTRDAVREAREANAYLVILPPDNLYSEGTFPALARWAEAGRKAVVLPGIRLTQETAAPEFLRRWPPEAAGRLSYPPRALARLALEHLHPLSQSLFTDSDHFHNEWPSHIYWRVDADGFLCTACHLHPLMVDPGAGGALGDSTIDGAFLEELCADPRDAHVAQDSDEMLALELSPRGQFPPKPPGHANPYRIARFIDNHTTALHRAFLDHPVRIHAGDCGPAWAAAERLARAGLDRVRAHRLGDRYRADHLALEMDRLVRDWHARRTRVVVYGAGLHTERLLQWTRLDQAPVVGFADRNPALHGRRLLGVPIVAPERIRELRPDVVLVSSFHHAQSIFDDLQPLVEPGTHIQGCYGPLRPSRELEQERL
jgi:hypothetical protein